VFLFILAHSFQRVI